MDFATSCMMIVKCVDYLQPIRSYAVGICIAFVDNRLPVNDFQIRNNKDLLIR